MPWKLIGIIVCIVLILFLVGFNLDNRTDISLLFFKLESVSTFIALFVAFLLGVIISIPLTFFASRKGGKSKDKKKKGKTAMPKSEAPQKSVAQESDASSG